MARLLHIQSSPNLQSSVTRLLSSQMVKQYCATHEGVEVEVLGLGMDPTL